MRYATTHTEEEFMAQASPTKRYPPGARSFLLTPHLQVGETVVTDVPGGHGILPHRDFQATTACGQTMASTLVTRDRERTRCQACYDASATTCVCGCGGEPRETNIQIGVRVAASGNVVPLGMHTPGHVYGRPVGGDEWVARHPNGQWTLLEQLDEEAKA